MIRGKFLLDRITVELIVRRMASCLCRRTYKFIRLEPRSFSGHPGFIYMQTPSNAVYYSVPTAPAPATAPYFYTPDVFVQQSYPMAQPMPQTQNVIPAEGSFSTEVI